MSSFIYSIFGVVVIGLIVDVFNSSNSQITPAVNFIFNLVVLIVILTPILNLIMSVM